MASPLVIVASAGDGYITRSTTGTWASLKAQTDGSGLDYTSNFAFVIAGFDGTTYTIHRGFLPFEGALPAGNAFTSASIALYSSSNYAGGSLCLVEGTQASVSALAAGDYHHWNTTDLATRRDGALSTGAYSLTLNAAGIAYLNSLPNGPWKFALLSSLDLDNSAPGSGTDTRWRFAPSEHATSSYRPVLTAAYAPTGCPKQAMHYARLRG